MVAEIARLIADFREANKFKGYSQRTIVGTRFLYK